MTLDSQNDSNVVLQDCNLKFYRCTVVPVFIHIITSLFNIFKNQILEHPFIKTCCFPLSSKLPPLVHNEDMCTFQASQKQLPRVLAPNSFHCWLRCISPKFMPSLGSSRAWIDSQTATGCATTGSTTGHLGTEFDQRAQVSSGVDLFGPHWAQLSTEAMQNCGALEVQTSYDDVEISPN